MRAISNLARFLIVALTAQSALTAAWCQAESAPPKLPPGVVQAQANGKIELLPAVHSPLYVEFERSEVLSQALAAAMQAKGFDISRGSSRCQGQARDPRRSRHAGRAGLLQGCEGARGGSRRKVLNAAADGRSTSPAEAAQAAVSLALESGVVRSAVSPFWRGLALGRMAEVLGDATGVRGAFNKALTGDPRGICLSRCEDWNKVKQTVYAFVSFAGPDGRQDIRVMATTISEALAPEESHRYGADSRQSGPSRSPLRRPEPSERGDASVTQPAARIACACCSTRISNLRRVKAAFDKVKAAIEAGDFRSADVKKLNAGPYYRARLDYANRLLLQFARIDRPAGDGGTETVCLALEVIENHAYERSRFLRGAVVDEARIEREPGRSKAPSLTAEATPLRWLGPGRTQFELLDKPIVFDEAQDEAYRHPAPLVVIGSAGSGKTAVTLARLREAEGRVLYVTLSAYLAQSARALHAALGFENPKQEVDFLSYRELLETCACRPAAR
jgi:hypothetical protein